MTLAGGNSSIGCTSSQSIQVFGTSSGLRGKWRAAPRADEMATIGCSAPLGQTCILGILGGFFFFTVCLDENLWCLNTAGKGELFLWEPNVIEHLIGWSI
jgi:hypothetical protein